MAVAAVNRAAQFLRAILPEVSPARSLAFRNPPAPVLPNPRASASRHHDGPPEGGDVKEILNEPRRSFRPINKRRNDRIQAGFISWGQRGLSEVGRYKIGHRGNKTFDIVMLMGGCPPSQA